MTVFFLFILLAGTVAKSTTVEAASLTPASPSNLVAKAVSANQINLSWKDNSNNEDGWIIDWKDAKASQWQSSKSVNPNVPNWGTGVYPNTTYIFRVSSYNKNGRSDFYSEAQATTPASAAPTKPAATWIPSVPTNLKASTIGLDRIDITWDYDPANITVFEIFVSSYTDKNWKRLAIVPASGTKYSYSNTGLPENQSFIYALVVYADNGQSSEISPWVTASTPVRPPSAASNLQAKVVRWGDLFKGAPDPGKRLVQLNWQDNSTNEFKFQIERKTGASGSYALVYEVVANKTDWVDYNITPGTLYYYRVWANVNDIRSTTAPEVSVTAQPPSAAELATYPETPVLVSPTSGTLLPGLEPKLVWKACARTTLYDVEVAKDAEFKNMLGDYAMGLSTTLDRVYDIESATTYYWRVNAVNDKGKNTSSVWTFKTSPASQVPLASRPDPVQLKSPVNSATGQNLTLRLEWQPVARAESYEITIISHLNPGVSTEIAKYETGLVRTVYDVPSGLSWNTSYEWYVVARNKQGFSKSPTWSFKTK